MAKKKAFRGNKIAKLGFKEAIFSLTILGSLWRTALAASVILTVMLIILGQTAYIGMTFNGGAPVYAVLSDGYIFYESLKGMIVFLAAFIIYDTVYVGIVNRYPVKDKIDKLLLLSFELLILAGLLISSIINVVAFGHVDWQYIMVFFALISYAMTVIFIGALLLPPVRAIIGVSWAVSKVKVRKR